MPGTQQWLTRRDYARLQNELAALRSRNRIEGAGGFIDYDGNLHARHCARQARISEVEELLARAIVDGEAVGEPVAEAGMVLTVRHEDTGETETFLLGRRYAEDSTAINVYSMASPLGRAITDARLGEQRCYTGQRQTGRLVTLLQAVPYRLHSGSEIVRPVPEPCEQSPDSRSAVKERPGAITSDCGNLPRGREEPRNHLGQRGKRR